MEYETAGDPISGLKWTRKTTQKIAGELQLLGFQVCPKTVARLLKTMNFSLRVNHKQISLGSNSDRDRQFERLAQLRDRFARRGDPIVSVETKKRELVGRFKNPGRTWSRQAVRVYDHDFRSQAEGIAIPYGIYDLQAHRATIFVGVSSDTPDCLRLPGPVVAIGGTKALSPSPPPAGAGRCRWQQLTSLPGLETGPAAKTLRFLRSDSHR